MQSCCLGNESPRRHGSAETRDGADAPASEAAALARRCRDMGLEPVMMFGTVQLEMPNAHDIHPERIGQAAAAGIPFLLTFGKTARGEYDTFVANLKSM